MTQAAPLGATPFSLLAVYRASSRIPDRRRSARLPDLSPSIRAFQGGSEAWSPSCLLRSRAGSDILPRRAADEQPPRGHLPHLHGAHRLRRRLSPRANHAHAHVTLFPPSWAQGRPSCRYAPISPRCITTIRPTSGMSAPASPWGWPVPSHRSWWLRAIRSAVSSRGIRGRRILAPIRLRLDLLEFGGRGDRRRLRRRVLPVAP